MYNGKGDTPPRSDEVEEENLQEQVDFQEPKEELEDKGEQVHRDGTEAELLDKDAEPLKDNLAGIKLSYILKQEEIFQALHYSKSYKSAKKRLIAESIISCMMSVVFFVMFGIQMNWLTLIFAILCVVLAVLIWPSSWNSLRKNAKRLTSGEEVQMEIYPSLIEMGKEEHKWIIPLDCSVTCKQANEMFVLQTDSDHITIIPLRCVEPSVLPDVQAMILSGTIQI